MRLKHTKDSLAIVDFIARTQLATWHSYADTAKIRAAMQRCAELGCIELSEATRQFRPLPRN